MGSPLRRFIEQATCTPSQPCFSSPPCLPSPWRTPLTLLLPRLSSRPPSTRPLLEDLLPSRPPLPSTLWPPLLSTPALSPPTPPTPTPPPWWLPPTLSSLSKLSPVH